MAAEATQPESTRSTNNLGWMAFLSAVLGVAFFLNGHSLTYSNKRGADFALSGAESAVSVEEGSSLRKVVYVSLGLFGLGLLLRSRGRPFSFADPLSLALLAYLAFCLASVLWSISPSLTLRRAIVLACCATAMFGYVRQLRGSQIVWMGLLCSTTFVMLGFLSELALGTFQPWTSGYRFSGTVHPNSQGQLCAFACLSSYALFRDAKRHRGLLLAIAMMSLFLLVMSGSRTAAIGLVIGTMVIWLPFARPQKLALAGVAAPLVICVAAFLAALMGADVESKVAKAVTMGRKSDVGSFSGRTPLWRDLAPQILDRPALGRGYLSFWTPERIADVSAKFQWTIPDAHNEYIDTMLNLGLFGAGLLATIVAIALVRGMGAYLKTGESTYGFFVCQIIVSLVAGCFESGFAQPLGLIPFVTACGVAYLACRMPAEAAQRHSVRQPVRVGRMIHA